MAPKPPENGVLMLARLPKGGPFESEPILFSDVHCWPLDPDRSIFREQFRENEPNLPQQTFTAALLDPGAFGPQRLF
jgi:hypothetical protein